MHPYIQSRFPFDWHPDKWFNLKRSGLALFSWPHSWLHELLWSFHMQGKPVLGLNTRLNDRNIWSFSQQQHLPTHLYPTRRQVVDRHSEVLVLSPVLHQLLNWKPQVTFDMLCRCRLLSKQHSQWFMGNDVHFWKYRMCSFPLRLSFRVVQNVKLSKNSEKV